MKMATKIKINPKMGDAQTTASLRPCFYSTLRKCLMIKSEGIKKFGSA